MARLRRTRLGSTGPVPENPFADKKRQIAMESWTPPTELDRPIPRKVRLRRNIKIAFLLGPLLWLLPLAYGEMATSAGCLKVALRLPLKSCVKKNSRLKRKWALKYLINLSTKRDESFKEPLDCHPSRTHGPNIRRYAHEGSTILPCYTIRATVRSTFSIRYP